ncbi:hypothetical protein LPJ69_004114 [Coemansia sp. RSA 1752]|nr:hypothetical protein LPJ69_004114 [Coemansia sp. RSA 1752]KAJ2446854.1 hypothetical protein IWW46_000673 [Coemansia sp. RSA 2440]KAJ2545135.1 hypothetical protein IWW35_005317 [Coemansia sp. RSA 1878]
MLALATAASTVPTTADADAKSRTFALLVDHAFGPATSSHASQYYKTRFFTAHLQSRMQYIVSQYTASDKKLTQTEADQLNSVAQEISRVARKLYHSTGCLSYDLTLCDGAGKGLKQSEGERVAIKEWEAEMNTPFEAKVLSRDEAKNIRDLTKNIQGVLLAHAV